MPEKIAIMTGSIMAFFTAVLGVVGRVTFVRKSQVFSKHNGRPLFQYADACAQLHQKDTDRTCAKIAELKDGQIAVRDELNKHGKMLERIDQRIIDHDKIHRKNSG